MNIIVLSISFLWTVCYAHAGVDVVLKANVGEQYRTISMTAFHKITKRQFVEHTDVQTGESNNDSVSKLRNESNIVTKEYRYHVANLDFANVSTPFVISLWIVFASIAKIGKYLVCYI